MQYGNPNAPANPFAPAQPGMNRNLNTYRGDQRILGQNAWQPPSQAYQRNSGLQAQVVNPAWNQGGGGQGGGGIPPQQLPPNMHQFGMPPPGGAYGGQQLPPNYQQPFQPNPQQALMQLMQLLQQGIY